MATTANDLDRAAARAARQAAREARAEVDRQLDQLLSDVQALIDSLREVADAKVALLRARVESALAATKAALTTPALHALERSDHYVRAQPWQLVGVAATTGLLAGLFMGRSIVSRRPPR
jgi:ElaB protein